MFTVPVPGSEREVYRVKWNHTENGTLCDITRGERSSRREDDEVVAIGFSIIHPHDQPNKNVGRKVSLSRALGLLGKREETLPLRKSFWQAYYAMRRNKW